MVHVLPGQKTSGGPCSQHDSGRARLRRVLLLAESPGLIVQSFMHVLRENGIDTVVAGADYPPDDVDFQAVVVLGVTSPFVMPPLTPWIERGIAVLAFVPDLRPELAREILAQGAAGVLDGNESLEIAIAAIRLASVGGIFAPTELIRAACAPSLFAAPGERSEEAIVEPEAYEDDPFTSREHDILKRLRKGLQNKTIAHDLGISENTVKVHLHHVMKKLQARNRTEVVCLLSGRLGAGVSA